MPKKRFLSLNAMDKILREAGGLRIGDDAKEALAEALQEQARKIAWEAKRYAEHAGRKTITGKDVELATK